MATMHISNWTVVDAADTDRPLTFEVFDTKEGALQWVHSREADIAEAIKNGAIGGTYLKEERIPARFLVTTPEALPYLGFDARIVEEVFITTIPRLIIGIPQEHAQWLFDRLGSGLVSRAGPFDTLEEALTHTHQTL